MAGGIIVNTYLMFYVLWFLRKTKNQIIFVNKIMNRKSIASTFLKFLAIYVLIFNFYSCIEDRSPSAPTEIDRPSNIGIVPDKGELAFPLNGIISMQFDEAMALSSFDEKLLLSDDDSNVVAGTFSKVGSTINFTPSNQLNKSTIYHASLKGGIKDENNNTIQLGGEPVFSDTSEIANTWFFTEGDYSEAGFYNVYLRDRKQGKIYTFENLLELGNEITSLSAPDGMMVSSDGQKILISNTSKNEMVVYNLSTYENLATFSLAQVPTNIVVFNNLAYVISVNGKKITIINTDNYSVVSQNDLSFFPGKLAISADGDILYTFDQVNLDLVLLNSSNFQIIKRISKSITGGISGELNFNSGSDELFICDSRGKTIRVIDKLGTQLANYFVTPSGSEPIQIITTNNISLVATGKLLYKLEFENAEIIDEQTFNSNIKSIAVIPTGDLIYVTLNSSVVLLDVKTFTVLREVDLGVTGLESIIASPIKF